MYPLSCLISSAISSLDMVSGSAGCVVSSTEDALIVFVFADVRRRRLGFFGRGCAVRGGMLHRRRFRNLISPRRVEKYQRITYIARRTSRRRTSPSTPTRRSRDRTPRSSARQRWMMDSFFQSSNHLYGATKSRIPCPRWTRNSSMKKAVRCSCLVAFVFVYECVCVCLVCDKPFAAWRTMRKRHVAPRPFLLLFFVKKR